MRTHEDAQSDLEQAVALVLSYTSAMNDVETRRYYRSRAEGGYVTSASDEEQTGGATAEELDAEYQTIFSKHCTERRRSYGGFLSSWSKGGRLYRCPPGLGRGGSENNTDEN